MSDSSLVFFLMPCRSENQLSIVILKTASSVVFEKQQWAEKENFFCFRGGFTDALGGVGGTNVGEDGLLKIIILLFWSYQNSFFIGNFHTKTTTWAKKIETARQAKL